VLAGKFPSLTASQSNRKSTPNYRWSTAYSRTLLPDAQSQSDPKNTHLRLHNCIKTVVPQAEQSRAKTQSSFRSMLRKKAIEFPFLFERHGRVGRIKFRSNLKIYGTYFWFAGRAVRNSCTKFEAAYQYLKREFARLDRAPENSPVAFALRSNVPVYHELEQLLISRCDAVSLRDAVDNFLAHKETKQFKPLKVADCIVAFHEANMRRARAKVGEQGQ
jgi:hypothetical protein